VPITDPLKTAQELRAAGAPPALAELLAQKLEAVAAASKESAFQDFQSEIKDLRAEINLQVAAFRAEIAIFRAEIELRFAKLETLIAEAKASQEHSLRLFMGAVLAALGVAVAIIKLFPNVQ